ncbi:diguanylate cyclase (GGDEF)-like protein [Bradyrhizobium sp. USDA 336]
MGKDEAMTEPDRNEQAAPPRLRSVVHAMIWATVPVLLLVQLLASAGVEASSFWSQLRQLDARMARVAESRAELIAEPLWKMRYDQVTGVLNEIMHDETIAAAAVYDDTGAAIARVVARPQGQSVAEVSHPIHYSNGNMAVQAGRIAIAYSRATLYADAGSRLMLLLVVGLLATFATLIAMRISANIFIGRPLAAMMSAVQRSKQDGRAYPADVTSSNEFGQLARAFNAMQHTTSGALDRLGHMATHDPLTGLPNRRSLTERLAVTSQNGGAPDTLVAFCFIDLDDFKGINDTFGHEAGDAFLVQISQRLRRAVEAEDWVARLGGDEFVVIRPEVSDEQAAHAFAQRVLDAISEPIRLHDKQVVPRASIGLAVRHADDPELSHLPTLADIALYHAKSKAPGTVAVLDEALQRDYRRRRDLELAIPTGFAEGQFEVWYQSQVDLDSHEVVGLEALIRWRHPEHGVIGPGEFLPLIERSGNNARLTRLRADRCLPGLAAIGRCGQAAAADRDQSAAVRACRPLARRRAARDLRALRCRGIDARARDHGGIADQQHRQRLRNAASPAAPGGHDRARRFRHRLFFARPSAAVSARQGEDRQGVHQRDPRQRRGQGHCRRHRLARRHAGTDVGRRRHRARRAGGGHARDGRAARAGVPLSAAAAARGRAAGARRAAGRGEPRRL